MKITKIKAKTPNKYVLEVDNENYQLLSDTLLFFNIYKPTEISKEEFNNLLEKNIFFENYHKLKTFIAFKMRTEKEIVNKLTQLKVPKSKHQEYLNKLKEDNLLDDSKYTEYYISDQINLTLNGPKKILINAKKLGLNENNVNNLLNNIEEVIWENKINKVINKKIKANHTLSKNKFIQKLRQDLINLGYSENQFQVLLNNVDFDDEKQYQKDYEKYKNKLSKKYEGDVLEYKLKEKMYQLGYTKNSQ